MGWQGFEGGKVGAVGFVERKKWSGERVKERKDLKEDISVCSAAVCSSFELISDM